MRQWLLYPSAGISITAVLHWLVGIPIGFSALIAFICWPIVGTVVTLDDDLPGGFSNSDGKATPDWLTAWFWGQLCGGGAVVCVAFLVQLGIRSPWPAYFVTGAVVFALISFLLLRRSHHFSRHAS